MSKAAINALVKPSVQPNSLHVAARQSMPDPIIDLANTLKPGKIESGRFSLSIETAFVTLETGGSLLSDKCFSQSHGFNIRET